MLVIMHHLIANTTNHLGYVCYNNFFNFGFIGVDFFFVLSGFIITYVHFADLHTPSSDSLKNFFKKRFLRIYPIYWVVAFITLLIYIKSTPWFLKDASLTMDLASPVILKFVAESFLLIPNENMRLVGVAWTLSYEVLFYIMFAFGIAFGFKFAKITSLIWIFLVLSYNLISPVKTEYLSFLFNVIVLEFLFGCVVAYFIRKKIKISAFILFPILILLFLLLLKNIHINGLVFNRNLINVSLMGLFFAIITYLAVGFDKTNTTVKFPAVLILIGDASYSIYLSHNMFLSALTKLYGKLNPHYSTTGYMAFVATIIFIVTVVLGILIHLLVEKKLLKVLSVKFFDKRKSPVFENLAA
ncbi:MAG: Peptidoglycan/LPS O-acetylase OafA/YrhL, contains acyltransferase and SGNH-hydrolase domain [Sphingobacteriales bacterium]|nr:Peptidoglycan/LPS O-acetylase OafA/YrhL, contains acyltransferase and SGNH-hydrolase domain [Sphingobacteriales bacterium]